MGYALTLVVLGPSDQDVNSQVRNIGKYLKKKINKNGILQIPESYLKSQPQCGRAWANEKTIVSKHAWE